MEYFVADSYTGWELIEAPFERNGKMYTKARTTCDRCYKGVYVTRVENGVPVPHPNCGGVCFSCNGTGFIIKEIRLYTKKEKDAATRSKERAAERKVEQKLAAAEQKKAEWLEREGFGPQGTTTIYIADDSFDKKNELKANGWKYSTLIGWHTTPENAHKDELYPATSLITLPWEDLISFNIYGEGFWLSGAKAYVSSIKEASKPKSASEWIGVVKDKIIELPVVIKRITGFQSQFGWTSVITFLNGENELVWMTTAFFDHKEGEHLLLSATVKEHKEYKSTKQTILSRVKAKKEEV